MGYRFGGVGKTIFGLAMGFIGIILILVGYEGDLEYLKPVLVFKFVAAYIYVSFSSRILLILFGIVFILVMVLILKYVSNDE